MVSPPLAGHVYIIDGNNCILLVRRSKTAPFRAFGWEVPGGQIEDGEDPKMGAIRELAEETGIVVHPGDVDVFLAEHSKIDDYIVFSHIVRFNTTPNVTLSFEHDKYQWMPIAKAVNFIKVGFVRHSIEVIQILLSSDDAYIIRTSTKAVLVNPDNKVLALKRSSTDPKGPGNWDLPGGGVDAGETLNQAIKREVQEEAGLPMQREVIKFVNTSINHDKKKIHIRVGQIANVASKDVQLSFEHDEYKWVEPEELSEMVHQKNWSDFAGLETGN